MHNLPPQLTLFIGRSEEIAEIHQLLANPECRLLTIVGVGGIGKTRLAIQAASEMASLFADGIYLVALQPITSTQYLVPAVADAIHLSLAGSEEPQVQLLNHLADRQILLLMDNFEHLLDGVSLLTAMLEAAPRLKMLVTSRENLQIKEEWLYPIGGLDFPKAAPEDALATTYSAVQLFVERARRIRRGFAPEAELADIVTICQMVEGLPLALELAAAWTQTLSCRAIAGEIRHNLDFLTTEWRNVPDRQRSMRAVFDHSRHLLTVTEQEVFKRMSVFRGGFRREAAEIVAGATLSTLGSLVSRSLLRWEPAGRYQLHELLRQYAEEHLRAAPQEKATTDDRHCAYYSTYLYKRLPDLLNEKQLETLQTIEPEIENIRVAWQYAVEMGKVEEIGMAVQALAMFYVYRGRHLEGTAILEQAFQKLALFDSTDPREMLVAIRFQELAWFYVRMGRFEEAIALHQRVQTFYEHLNIPPIEGASTDPLALSSIIATIQGEYQAAVRFGKEALARTEIHPHVINRQYALYALTGATLAQGQYEVAQQYAQAAYVTTQLTQDRWFMAYCLIEMGNVASAMHDYTAARQHWEASYAIRREFNDPEGMAVALSYLGEVALRQQQYEEAQTSYEQSLALYRDLNDRGGLARSLDGLGNAACALGNYAAARQHLTKALQIAGEIQFVPLIFSILSSIGHLLLRTGNSAGGVALLTQVSRHPNSTTTSQARARQLLANDRGLIEKEIYETAAAQSRVKDLKTLTTVAQLELDGHAGQVAPPPPLSISPSLPNPQSLIDPLTKREMEILTLIAGGLSNREIATKLHIALGTVKWYTSQIYSKLGIGSRTQAIARGKELSLIP